MDTFELLLGHVFCFAVAWTPMLLVLGTSGGKLNSPVIACLLLAWGIVFWTAWIYHCARERMEDQKRKEVSLIEEQVSAIYGRLRKGYTMERQDEEAQDEET